MSDKRIVYAEDAIKAVHNLYAIFGSEGEWVDRKDVFEAIDSLPPAQPQSCKDAVSKADVLETYAELYDVFDDNKEIKNELHKIYDKINALQAAQPQRMKGRWVNLQCTQCGQVDTTKPNFCPNCGSDNRGDEDDG